MSSSALAWAFGQRLATSQQQVLLYVIAESADQHGMARQCDANHLAECSRLSRAGLLKCISSLRAAGAIETTEKCAEDGSRVFDIRLLLDKSVSLQRTDKPSGEMKPLVTSHDVQSAEGRAIILLHELAGLGQYLHRIMVRNGFVSYPQLVTPRLLGLAQAGPPGEWKVLTAQQAGAWESLLRDHVTIQVRKHLTAGDRAPWLWPPSVEGKVYTAGADPPDVLMSDEEAANFR